MLDDFTVKHRWRVHHYKNGTLAFRSLDPNVDPTLKNIIKLATSQKDDYPALTNAIDNSLGTTPVHPHLTHTYSHY